MHKLSFKGKIIEVLFCYLQAEVPRTNEKERGREAERNRERKRDRQSEREREIDGQTERKGERAVFESVLTFTFSFLHIKVFHIKLAGQLDPYILKSHAFILTVVAPDSEFCWPETSIDHLFLVLTRSRRESFQFYSMK